MEERLLVTASPHIRDHSTTRGLMGSVVVALLPCVLASALIFGVQALVLVVVTTFACVAFEYLYEVLLHKPNTVGDLSAVWQLADIFNGLMALPNLCALLALSPEALGLLASWRKRQGGRRERR